MNTTMNNKNAKDHKVPAITKEGTKNSGGAAPVTLRAAAVIRRRLPPQTRLPALYRHAA